MNWVQSTIIIVFVGIMFFLGITALNDYIITEIYKSD